MEELKKILGEELYQQVTDKLGDKKLLIDDGKSMIPYHRFEEVIAKNNALKEQLAKREEDLKQLETYAKGNEELKKKLEELQSQSEAYKQEFAKKEIQMKKQLALKEALMNEGVVDTDARDLLLGKFDLEKIELENDKIKNFENMVAPLKTHQTLSKLFGNDLVRGKTPAAPNTPEGFLTREQVEKMNQEEVLANYDLIQKSMINWSKQNS